MSEKTLTQKVVEEALERLHEILEEDEEIGREGFMTLLRDDIKYGIGVDGLAAVIAVVSMDRHEREAGDE